MLKEKEYQWNDYLICLCPLAIILYIGNETYAIDYRAFYLAGKAFINGLNPYINHIALSDDFYGPVNAELAYYSGWKYPPLATYIFAPLSLLKYELSKNIFNSLTLLVATLTISGAIKHSKFTIPPEALLIAGLSFPVLSTISRGQIDILLVCISVMSIYLFSKRNIFLGSSLLAIISFIKIFPGILLVSYIRKPSFKKYILSFCLTCLFLLGITYLICPSEWIDSFITRATIPWDEVPGKVMAKLPDGSGIIEGSMSVESSDARNLIHSHYFVFGFANPLLSKNITLSTLIGITGSLFCSIKYRKQSIYLISFTIMNWINIINPISWIMGLSWYIPLFLYSYIRVKRKYKFLICLPLILPPFLNASGYLSAIISMIITKLYKREYMN